MRAVDLQRQPLGLAVGQLQRLRQRLRAEALDVVGRHAVSHKLHRSLERRRVIVEEILLQLRLEPATKQD